jgi:hypothetical protein
MTDNDQLAAGGDGARSVMETLFPDSIWLEPDLAGKHFIAVLSMDGVGQLLYDWHDNVGDFPIVGNSMVAGARVGFRNPLNSLTLNCDESKTTDFCKPGAGSRPSGLKTYGPIRVLLDLGGKDHPVRGGP